MPRSCFKTCFRREAEGFSDLTRKKKVAYLLIFCLFADEVRTKKNRTQQK